MQINIVNLQVLFDYDIIHNHKRGIYMVFSNSDQLKSYLLKYSRSSGMGIQNAYNTFFSRRLLEILSKYTFGQIIVKGSFSQFVHLGKLYRPITDIDLTSPGSLSIANDILNHSVECENKHSQIHFEFRDKIQASRTGIVQLSACCNFGSIRHVIGIDIKCDNVGILETQYKPVRPIFEGDSEFYINTPSYEEHLAEKLCIIAESNKPDKINSRLKDFYDIYQLHGGQYDFAKLSIYFKRMLKLRNKVALENVSTEYLNLHFIQLHQPQWEISKRKYEFLDRDVDLNQVVSYSRAVLSEQLQKARCLSKREDCY